MSIIRLGVGTLEGVRRKNEWWGVLGGGMRKSQEFWRFEIFQAVIYLCKVVFGGCVYRLWICKQHMCKPLAIVLKMAVWPIISISVFKHEPDDAMFYLKLVMYHPGWKLVPLKHFHIVYYAICCLLAGF